ncbi:MAG TPA: hypothetical protein VKD72_10690 [Gemmataceae bacterium]|nr:hypothetical protein [Gemmataceae bacterium]
MLRPVDGLLHMSALDCDARVAKPSAFEQDAPKPASPKNWS